MSGILQGLLASLQSAVAVVTDPFFNLVTLLLNDNGVNGAQNNTFLDSSSNAFTITRNGNTTQGTFTPFSQTGWSDYLDGSSYLTVASGATSFTGDFTIEFWYNPAVINSDNYLFDSAPSLNTFYVEYYSGSLSFNYSAAQVCPSTAITLTPGVWYHIAIVRSGSATNNCSLYVNGSRLSQGTKTGPMSLGSGGWTINAAGNGGFKGNGYYSNFRVTNGGALYSGASFTVPTSPLTTTVSSGTVSVLTCQDNRFKDNSANGYTVSVGAGTPSVQAFSPFAPTAAYSAAVVGGSGYFDGTGDNITTATNTAFTMGTGAFTLECWVYPTSSMVSGACFITGTSTNDFQFGHYVSNQFGLAAQGTGWLITSSAALVNNAWNHCVFVRSGTGANQASLFLNGTRVANGTVSNNFSNTQLCQMGNLLAGYICGSRVVKGSAVYDPTQTTLTIPTAPPTAITNTQLLLNYTNAGIYDSSAKNDLETVGNAQVSTTQAKFGTTSMSFNGTNSYLRSYQKQMFQFNGDFTIEVWVYMTSLKNYNVILDTRTGAASATGFSIGNTSAGNFYVDSGSGRLITSSSTYSANTWYYVALVRSGSTITLYVNGTSAGTTTLSTAFTDGNGVIGTDSIVGGTSYFAGYMDDFRITLGYARTITTPTTAFPVQ